MGGESKNNANLHNEKRGAQSGNLARGTRNHRSAYETQQNYYKTLRGVSVEFAYALANVELP